MFHADLSDAHPDEDHWISVAGQRIPLVPHTDATLNEAMATGHEQLYARRENARLTHRAAQTVQLPADTVVRVHLRHSQKNVPGAKAEHAISHSAIWYPPAAHHLAALAPDAVIHAPPIDYVSTAQNFLFHHADVINKDPVLTGIIIEKYMIGDKNIATAINNMADLMRSMGAPREKSGWATLEAYVPPATAPKNKDEHFDGTTAYYMQMPTPAVQEKAREPLKPLLVSIQNDPKFRDKKWTVEPGQAVIPEHQARPAPLDGPVASPMVRTATVTGDTTGDNWQAKVANGSSISGCQTSISIVDAAKKKIKIKMSNTYIRYLAGYIRFYNAAGEPMKVKDWTPDDPDIAYKLVAEILGIQYDDVRYLGLISPMNNVLAIPFGPPGTIDVTVTFPEGAVSCSVYGSGLGIGDNPWPKTPALGGTMTGVLNLAVPAFMLGFGVAAQSYKPLYDIIQGLTKNRAFIVAAGGFVTAWIGWIIGSSVAHQQMNWSSFTSLISFVFDKSATKALVWIELDIAGNELADQIPFAGWIMLAINIATGIAQMAQTIIEVATSDWNIEDKIATTITTNVKVHPDPRHKVFPAGGALAKRTLTVKMMYKEQTRPTVQQTIDVPNDSKATELTVQFAGNTLGGEVKFEADFFIDTWLAGKATTGYIPNDDEHVATVVAYLVEYPVPLDDKSIYTHAQILTYKDGSYGWMVTNVPPIATITSRNTSPTGNAIGDWTGLTLSQRYGMLGSSWQAAGMGINDCDTGGGGQLYAFQNLNIPGSPMKAEKFPSCGFAGQTRLIYDPYPPKFLMEGGQWKIDPSTNQPYPDPTDDKLGEYYVDPRPASLTYDHGGGYHLRKVTLDNTTPFDMNKVQPSFGRFAYFPDSVTMHPSGLVIGVSAKYQKLQIVRLGKKGLADIDVPLGQIGTGPATDPGRPGLMYYPVAVTCAYDGTIIVLEDTKSSTGTHATTISRLSAYDLQMNPVSRFFDQEGKPTPWLYLANADKYYYLDVASVGDEKMTYIYILYYTGSGGAPSDYHMAIYTYGVEPPKSNPLVTTDGIAAAKMTVDMWHTAYTLNFAMVMDAKGNPAGPKNDKTGPGGRTAASVSMWVPPVPHS